jgi:BolA protein
MAVVITPEVLETKIRAGIEGVQHVVAVDESDGCGSKFTLTVVSPAFSGLKIIACHRLVHKALEVERPHIHALTIHTKTPESYASEQGEQQEAT